MSKGQQRPQSAELPGATGLGALEPNRTASRALSRETDIDWASARGFLKRVLRRGLDRVPPDQIQDLTQEALVRLLRAVRKEDAVNLEALMTEIARRTRIDFIRRRRTWSSILEPLGEAGSNHADPSQQNPDELGDPIERLEFVVIEFFRARHAPCVELARRYFADQEWTVVATTLGRHHDAVRQQWSRCLSMLRKAAADDPSLLAAWANPASGNP